MVTLPEIASCVAGFLLPLMMAAAGEEPFIALWKPGGVAACGEWCYAGACFSVRAQPSHLPARSRKSNVTQYLLP